MVKWQTRAFEGRMPQGVGVQVPLRAPPSQGYPSPKVPHLPSGLLSPETASPPQKPLETVASVRDAINPASSRTQSLRTPRKPHALLNPQPQDLRCAAPSIGTPSGKPPCIGGNLC